MESRLKSLAKPWFQPKCRPPTPRASTAISLSSAPRFGSHLPRRSATTLNAAVSSARAMPMAILPQRLSSGK